MSDDDAPVEREGGPGPLIRPKWEVLSQSQPPDPRGKYYRLHADPRREEIAAVALEVEALEAELARLAELADERRTTLLAEAQQPQTEATFVPPREAARQARLQAAQAALSLAAALLAVDAPEEARAAAAQADTCEQAIAAWKRSGRGWFESRIIVKFYEPAQVKNDQAGAYEWRWLPVSFGPYRYFRWREPDAETGELKLHTWYLGKQEAADRGGPTTPAQPGRSSPPISQYHGSAPACPSARPGARAKSREEAARLRDCRIKGSLHFARLTI